MKYDVSILTQAINNAKGCILGKQQRINVQGNQYRTWPLFLTDTFNNSDIDVCTSGLGVVALTQFDYVNDSTLMDSISQSINTILSIRNDDGSWPSKISLLSNDSYSMEGVISDIYYAITALLSVGFLNNSSHIKFKNLKTGEVLDTLDKRIKYIEKSVEWLLANRVENNQGWQYTGVRYLENPTDKELQPAYTMPTTNAIIILAKINESLNSFSSNHPLIEKINEALKSSINWLCVVQSKDYGFGIKRGDSSRVSNTAKIIKALSEIDISPLTTDLQKQISELVKRAVNWVAKFYKPNKVSFADVTEDFTQVFIEIDATSGVIKNVFRRPIIHETYLEAAVVDALFSYYKANKSNIKLLVKNRIFSVIDKALSIMLSSQNQNGELFGAIESRRQTDSEKYTMYSTCDFVLIINRLLENVDELKNILHNSNRFRVKLCILVLIGIIAIGLPLFIGKDTYVYTIPGSLVLGIFVNYISGKIL